MARRKLKYFEIGTVQCQKRAFPSSKSKPPPGKLNPPQSKNSPLNPANFEPPFIFQIQNGQPTHHLGVAVEAME